MNTTPPAEHSLRPTTVPWTIRYILAIPFIYGMIVPAVLWHLCIEIYHQVSFRLYGIPFVHGDDYFVYDRQLMTILTTWEKLNCVYCSYVNNLIRYSMEIAGRTERYWCPLKYHRQLDSSHAQYHTFLETADNPKLRAKWEKLRAFEELKS